MVPKIWFFLNKYFNFFRVEGKINENHNANPGRNNETLFSFHKNQIFEKFCSKTEIFSQAKYLNFGFFPVFSGFFIGKMS
jgi:hypothetical protein